MKLVHSISPSIILAISWTVCSASSTSSGCMDDIIKIPITTLPHVKRPSTVGRWEHTLRKYGLSTNFSANNSRGPKSHQRERLTESDKQEKKKTVKAPLVDFDFDREYYGTVLVGEPPQAFKIDFDTGSSRFILTSKDCIECSGASRYDPTLSKTFRMSFENTSVNISKVGSENNTVLSYNSSMTQMNQNMWHITYGDMSYAEGFLGWDDVTLGFDENSSGTKGLTVQYQELALVTDESANFDEAIDGIMGLAFGTLASSTFDAGPTKSTTKTVFENMISQGLVDKGVFSFFLGKASRGGGGEVIFGGWDPSRIAEGSELVFTNVTRPKYWQINIDNVFVSGSRVEYTPVKPITYLTPKSPIHRPDNSIEKEKRSNITGIMDTGTTLMIAPYRLTNAIHALIPGARLVGQSWTVPCNLGRIYPTGKLELQIEGNNFAVPFEDMVREPIEQSQNQSYPLSSGDITFSVEEDREGNAGKQCFSGVQPSGASFMVIGDVFIKNNYVVFDQEHRRVGIAPLRLPDLPVNMSMPNATEVVVGKAMNGN